MPLDRPSFRTVTLAEGYDMGEVDDAVDRVFDALAEPVPSMTAEDVSGFRFTPVRLRQGYSIGDVDDWLDVAAAELTQRGGTAAPEDGQATSPRSSYDPTGTSAAITEVPSGTPMRQLVAGLVVVIAVVVLVYAFLT